MKRKTLGVYIHIPFCAGKCPYCDFYSVAAEQGVFDEYTKALVKKAKGLINKHGFMADTIYFGGGTPSIIGAKRLSKIIKAFDGAKTRDCEIAVECNPSSVDEEFFKGIAKSGVNRISLGLQSAVESERKALGRRSGSESVARAVELARQSGISNISLDLMLGVPKQTLESLDYSLNFCLELDINHISAYILKIEENTPFFKNKDSLDLPDEEKQCELYLRVCEVLNKAGLEQYEISNFAKKGFESRHNRKYWHCEEYIGIGSSAHSFVDGKRFYYERDLNSFIKGVEPIFDCYGGDISEHFMLSLRLNEGISFEKLKQRYNYCVTDELIEKAKDFQKMGLLTCDENGIRLNSKGFLLSNNIISELDL